MDGEHIHYIRIENLRWDPYSVVFVDGKEYDYFEYAPDIAEALTKIFTKFNKNHEDFYVECVDVETFSGQSDKEYID